MNRNIFGTARVTFDKFQIVSELTLFENSFFCSITVSISDIITITTIIVVILLIIIILFANQPCQCRSRSFSTPPHFVASSPPP